MASSSVLTVAIATYRDFDGLYFTLQSFRAHHPANVDVVVLDNAPERCVRTESVTRAVGGRYYHRPDLDGTSRSRDAAIRLARTEWVLCCDSHVLFESSAISSLLFYLNWYAKPEEMYSGPMVSDGGEIAGTRWTPPRPNCLWGTWDVPPSDRTNCAENKPFEIPMNGLGAFVVNRRFWCDTVGGFNPLFRGFGGEEGYVHEKYRRLGGRVICLPALKWRHRFRDVGGWDKNPVPYPLRGEDHVWNLVVGHRELDVPGFEAEIQKDFGDRVAADHYRQLLDAASRVQPIGTITRRPDLPTIRGLWYSDNTAPGHLAVSSLASVAAAVEFYRAAGGEIEIGTCSWHPIPGNPLPWREFTGERRRSHLTILDQMHQASRVCPQHAEGDYERMIVSYLEHDVLYPENYFERVGRAFAENPDRLVASNLDYIGLNAQGWQPVRERHEPMHQLSMRWHFAWANHERARREFTAGNPDAVLEPHNGDGPARDATWVRLAFDPGLGLIPSVHVNHTKGRFTTHGEVCYAPAAATDHPHWGRHDRYWPEPVSTVDPGCGCAAPLHQYETPDQWADAASATPSDFHEHVNTLRALAGKCTRVAELVKWGKPSLPALLAGCPGVVYSLAPGQNGPLSQWSIGQKLAPDRFRPAWGEGAKELLGSFDREPVDLMFIDTDHRRATLFAELVENAPRVSKYIVVHCTETFGLQGDDGGPGVMPALREFVHRNKEWVAVRKDANNNGLVILSRCDEDRKTPPGMVRKALNFAKAVAAHVAAGKKIVSDEIHAARLDECLMCPNRALDTCALCGCPIADKTSWAEQECPDKPARWTKNLL